MGRLRLAIFDCDGTLIDSAHSIVACMQGAWRVHGLEAPTEARVRRVIGLSLTDVVAALLPEPEPDLVTRLAATYREQIAELRARPEHLEPFYPGVEAALRRLDAEGVLLGVATGKGMRGLIRTLEILGVRDLFVTLQTPDVAPAKPHPGMVLQALAETGVDAAEAVVIGDTTYDMQMARAAGVAALGVGWGYHLADELRAVGAAAVLAHGDEIAPAVARVLSAVVSA